MIKRNTRRLKRSYRHKRIRKKLSGTADVPRVSVFKSSKHIYAQVIDDQEQKTVCSASTLTPEIRKQIESNKELNNIDKANLVGKYIGDILSENKINEIKFDRSGYPYHGRVKSLADGIREKGIKF